MDHAFEVVNLANDSWIIAQANDIAQVETTVHEGVVTIGIDTMGTDDASVKSLAIRRAQTLVNTTPTRVEALLHWPQETNTSYLSAGLYVVSDDQVDDPEQAEHWVAIELVGVPPGDKARAQVVSGTSGRFKWLESFGWPQQREKAVRTFSRIGLAIEMNGDTLRVFLGDQEVYTGPNPLAGLPKLSVVLRLKGHSNYTFRSVQFSEIRVVEES